MKKALVHDWYSVYGGAEKCIESLTNIWDDFEHFSLIDNLTSKDRDVILKGKNTTNSFIQKLPFGKKKYRMYLPLFPMAIEQLNLDKYELIISSSSSVSKGILSKSDQLHISYVHSPMRYAWDLYFQYLTESGLNKGIKGSIAKYFLHKIRMWDYCTANRPDFYIANSEHIARRIKKIYDKQAMVIYPPVDTNSFDIVGEYGDYYITCSRMVPYKKMDLIVEAFSKTDKKLVVIGDGPDFKKIKALAGPNVELRGFLPHEEKKDLISRSKAFIFAAEEDFGIAPIEAQAAGIPVIAYGKGGILETVIGDFPKDYSLNAGSTGVFFQNQTVDSLLDAIHYFEANAQLFQKEVIRKNACRFSTERFEKEFKETIENLYTNWKQTQTKTT